MTKLRVLDLFSGVGGFSLGLERTGGFETVAFCEIEPFPRRVLAKHWPGVPVYEDVTTADFGELGPVDVVTAGFPCQDISLAGKGAGLSGERSGLFWHIIRTAGLVGWPQLLLENVAALLNRGMGEVLGALASVGYDTEWHCIPASAVGAPHRRDRVWIVADSGCRRRREPEGGKIQQPGRAEAFGSSALADATGSVRCGRQGSGALPASGGQDVADAYGARLEGWFRNRERAGERSAREGVRSKPGEWLPEPDVGRVAHGIPARAHRLRALGNAVVPQIPELLGRAILEARQ